MLFMRFTLSTFGDFFTFFLNIDRITELYLKNEKKKKIRSIVRQILHHISKFSENEFAITIKTKIQIILKIMSSVMIKQAKPILNAIDLQ